MTELTVEQQVENLRNKNASLKEQLATSNAQQSRYNNAQHNLPP